MTGKGSRYILSGIQLFPVFDDDDDDDDDYNTNNDSSSSSNVCVTYNTTTSQQRSVLLTYFTKWNTKLLQIEATGSTWNTSQSA
jgi:hypothetical protein